MTERREANARADSSVCLSSVTGTGGRCHGDKMPITSGAGVCFVSADSRPFILPPLSSVRLSLFSPPSLFPSFHLHADGGVNEGVGVVAASPHIFFFFLPLPLYTFSVCLSFQSSAVRLSLARNRVLVEDGCVSSSSHTSRPIPGCPLREPVWWEEGIEHG